MTNTTTQAPERVLAWTVNDWGSAWSVAPEDAAPDAVEYIRADLHTALMDERDALSAQLAEVQAERDALIAAGERAWSESCENHAKEPPMKYMAPYGGLVSLRNAIDQIGSKPHSRTPLPPDRIWIDAHGGNWSDRAGGTQEHEYVREDLLSAAETRARSSALDALAAYGHAADAHAAQLAAEARVRELESAAQAFADVCTDKRGEWAGLHYVDAGRLHVAYLKTRAAITPASDTPAR